MLRNKRVPCVLVLLIPTVAPATQLLPRSQRSAQDSIILQHFLLYQSSSAIILLLFHSTSGGGCTTTVHTRKIHPRVFESHNIHGHSFWPRQQVIRIPSISTVIRPINDQRFGRRLKEDPQGFHSLLKLLTHELGLPHYTAQQETKHSFLSKHSTTTTNFYVNPPALVKLLAPGYTKST
jgi:hypothetical protein